jgi:large-conductance mechanosensitive channel
MTANGTILTFAVAIYVGSALKEFFGSISKDLVAPFVAALFPTAQQTLDKIVVQVGPVKLNIGDVIGAVLNLAIALMVVSFTLPYIKEYSPVRGGGR